MTVPALRWLARVSYLGAALALAWRIVALQLAEHFASLDTPTAATSALAWYPEHPGALYEFARQQLPEHPEQAAAWLQRAAQANPADGRIYAALAVLQAATGHSTHALELAAIADRLAPMRADVQRELALLNRGLGRTDAALAHLVRALDAGANARPDLFAALLALIDDPRVLAKAGSLIAAKSWKPAFFAYAIERARGLDVLDALYRSGMPTVEMRRQLIARYQHDERWTEAYLVWIDGLSDQQLKALGNVYDGGFEQPFGDDDFGWRAPAVAGVTVQLEPRGDGGGRALRVTFAGEASPFRDVYQTLLLRPGRYRLQGEARTEQLQAVRGLGWTLQCKAGTNQVIGSTAPLKNTSPWREFALDFGVPPADCPAQDLRLELSGRFAAEFEASGVAWFDNIRIVRLPN